MSLGIFSFDLAALINSLSNFLEAAETQNPPLVPETTLDNVEDVLQNSNASVDSAIDDILMAAALNSTITSVITTAEPVKKENPPEKTPPVAVRVPTVEIDEETRREIERLIKSLQTTVTHNYRSSDIIDEAVSLDRVANFPKHHARENTKKKNDNVEQDRKRETQKLEMLRDELKKAIMKNNTGV